ncbi:MAG: hypothetical protein ACKOET_19455, partial [Verrucomicrobiota bacterium]
IIQAVEEKLARRAPVEWEPKTRRGRQLAAMLERGRDERRPLLDEAALERELAERRGRMA